MKKNQITALAVLLILLLSACSGKSGSESKSSPSPSQGSSGSSSSSGQGGQGQQEEEGEPHEYIKEAKTVKIEPIESAKLDISDVVFLDGNTIAITCPKDIGEKKSFIYNLETKQTVKIPDNTKVIKKLDKGDLFIETGTEGAYAILDGASYTVKKAIVRPDTVDLNLDLSPNEEMITYITNEGLFVSNTDFQNPVKIIDSKRDKDEFKTIMPRYPSWLDNNRISYRMLGWETVKYCAVVMRDGTNNKIYENAKDSSIYPLISGDFISRGEYGKGVALIDGITGEKKIISKAEIEYEGFAYDKNGKWVCFYRTNSEESEESKWTGKLEIHNISSGEMIKEYKSEKPNSKPIESAIASPDGKFLLFTDMDKSGRLVLYKLEIKLDEKSGSSSS